MSVNFNYTITALQDISALENLAIVSNPNNGLFLIKLTLSSTKKVTFKLFDLFGATIYKSPSYQITGKQIREINAKAYPSGLYLLEVRIGEKAFLEKVVIIR